MSSSEKDFDSEPFWSPLLRLLTLSAVAFGQPLLDLFGRYPELFVARDFTAGELWLLVIVLIF